MKLGYVLGEFPSLSETFILREIDALSDRGFDLTLYVLKRPGPGPVHEEAARWLGRVTYRPPLFSRDTFAALGYYLVRHPAHLWRVFCISWGERCRRPLSLLRAWRQIPAAAVFARRARRLGVVHLHAHFAGFPADVARAAAILADTGFSFSAHAADIHGQSAAVLDGQVRSARFVAACTRDGLAAIGARCGRPAAAHVRLVRHGVPRPAGEPTFARDALILAVGRLQPKKGFLTLVEACALLAERQLRFRCVIVGEGPERAALEAALRQRGLAGQVELAGAQTQAQIAAWLRTARLFVLPCVVAPNGDRDGVPNALLEAMASGVPVVSTPVGGVPEAVEHARTGLLVPPGDARALAGCLEELLKNDGLCRTLGLSGRALAAERFDIARNVAPLAALFEGTQQTV